MSCFSHVEFCINGIIVVRPTVETLVCECREVLESSILNTQDACQVPSAKSSCWTRNLSWHFTQSSGSAPQPWSFVLCCEDQWKQLYKWPRHQTTLEVTAWTIVSKKILVEFYMNYNILYHILIHSNKMSPE